jgi:beta-glucosidase-like glycosyl hydrolase
MSNALVIRDHAGKPERISKRLRSALDLMIWPDENGRSMEWYEAARAVGIAKESMRRSLRRPVTRRYLQTEQQVFRASLSSRIPARLGQLAFQNQNANAAVSACKVVLGDSEQIRSASGEARPWLTIRIVSPSTSAVIEPTAPVIEHESTKYDPNDPLQTLPEPRFRDPTDPNR